MLDLKQNKLLTRIISALVMLPVAIFVILNGGLAYFILVSILSFLILSEWSGITEKKPLSIVVFVQFICIFLILYQLNTSVIYIDNEFLRISNIELSVLSSIVSVIAAAQLIGVSKKWALLGFVYVAAPSASFILLNQDQGGVVVLWMMIVIWSMDIGAYFAGKNIGGPKMSPTISPNKTWSGLCGGAILAMILGYFYGNYFNDGHTPIFENALFLLLFSGFFAILSQVGDLAESAVKRKFEVKDSGSIIPGHGGVMDRVDGIIFVAPLLVILHSVFYS